MLQLDKIFHNEYAKKLYCVSIQYNILHIIWLNFCKFFLSASYWPCIKQIIWFTLSEATQSHLTCGKQLTWNKDLIDLQRTPETSQPSLIPIVWYQSASNSTGRCSLWFGLASCNSKYIASGRVELFVLHTFYNELVYRSIICIVPIWVSF